MKDAVISAATLAGLVGLACLYGNGTINHRARREAVSVDELGENNTLDADIEASADWEFINSLGFFDENADVPVELVEDVAIYAKSSGQKKGIGFIKKCLQSGNPKCKEQAINTVEKWGTTNAQYMSNNYDVLMKPVVAKIVEDLDNVEMGACAPSKYDGGNVFPCSSEALNDDFELHQDFANSYSAHPDYTAAIEQWKAESSVFRELTAPESLIPSSSGDPNNVFTAANMKFFFIQPNGIPVSMADDYQEHWGNYWNFMVDFNDRFLGVHKLKVDEFGNQIKGRSNMHFWFIRQDKQPRYMMKAPAKATSRFPWKRFEGLMAAPQASAVQPKLLQTYRDVLKQVENRNMGSSYTNGNDCAILWFHQYIPGDILSLTASEGQEIISALDKKCNIIHYWVGFNHEDSYKVVAYLQGTLQPSQKSNTAYDADLRDYFFIKDLAQLKSGSAEQKILLDATYNSIALDRKRCKCFFQTAPVDIASVIDAYMNAEFGDVDSERQDNFYGPSATETAAPEYYETANAINMEYQEGPFTTDAPLPPQTGAIGFAPVAEEPDYICCGIGLNGVKYNYREQECCEDGSIRSFDPSGDSMCP